MGSMRLLLALNAPPCLDATSQPPSVTHTDAQHVARLPVEGDALSTMDDAERRALGADLKLTIGDTLRAMDAAQALIPVEVRLVGFDGAGAGGVRVDARALEAQLRTLHAQLETVALEPVPRHMVRFATTCFVFAGRIAVGGDWGLPPMHCARLLWPRSEHLLMTATMPTTTTTTQSQKRRSARPSSSR